jgi:hypothetical protein
MKKLIYILFSLAFLTNSYAQTIPPAENIPAHIAHLSFEDRVSKSDAIVEGKVIGTDGFLGLKGSVFTSVIIQISKIFKGDIKDTIVELVIEGGTIPSGPYKGAITAAIDGCCPLLYKGMGGMFFLRQNNSSIQSGKKIQSYFYLQGLSLFYYHTDPFNPPATGPDQQYHDLEKELYEPIEAITGSPRKTIGPNLIEIETAKKQQK